MRFGRALAGAVVGYGVMGQGQAWALQAGSVRSETAEGQFVTALPPHLQTVQRRFKHYADTTVGGRPAISSTGFIRAVLGIDKDEPVPAHAVEVLEQRFRKWEGGALTFDAFAQYQLMARLCGADADRVFTMYDAGERRQLSREQFVEMMDNLSAHADRSAIVDGSSGYASKAFSRGDISWNQWEADLVGLQGDVWLASFGHFDKSNKGALAPQEFIALAYASVGLTDASAKRRLQKIFHPTGSEPLDIEDAYDGSHWVALNRVLLNRYRVQEVSQLAKNRFPLTPDKFYDLMRACELKVTRPQSDIIFAIFDRNGHRVLSATDLNHSLNLFRRACPSD